jgi:hypothetical protein
MTDAILAILILLPIVLTIFLKSNAALAVLAVCTGYTLDNLAGSDLYNGMTNIKLNSLSNTDVDLILLIAPVILTLVFTTRSWHTRTKMITQLVAAAAAGLMLAIIALPFISSVVDINFSSSNLWPVLQHIRAPVIIFGIIYSLILIWLAKNKVTDKKHKH